MKMKNLEIGSENRILLPNMRLATVTIVKAVDDKSFVVKDLTGKLFTIDPSAEQQDEALVEWQEESGK